MEHNLGLNKIMSIKLFNLNLNKLVAWIAVIGLILLWSVPVWAAPDNRIFAELLAKHNHNGVVDYAGFKKEEARLDAYLDMLAGVDPDALPRDDRFAFYVNAYNAWTIKLILTGYPGVKSIKDLGSFFKSPWKKKFVRLGGDVVTLDHIEHDILRPQFKDPRVHMAVNCASKGCPPLWHEPFSGSRLDDQLNAAVSNFINNPGFNRLEGGTLYVSRIFKWFNDDFDDDVIGFVAQYATGELKRAINARRSSLDVEYLDYDWSLNGS
jgi:hypothetical protein